MEFPTTLLESYDQLPDNDACLQYLEAMRSPDGFVCPRYQGARASYVGSRRLYQCSSCRYPG